MCQVLYNKLILFKHFNDTKSSSFNEVFTGNKKKDRTVSTKANSMPSYYKATV